MMGAQRRRSRGLREGGALRLRQQGVSLPTTHPRTVVSPELSLALHRLWKRCQAGNQRNLRRAVPPQGVSASHLSRGKRPRSPSVMSPKLG